MPTCVRCSHGSCWEIRRRRFKGQMCRREFSVTTGTVFAFRKMSFQDILAAAVVLGELGDGQERPPALPRAGRPVQDRLGSPHEDARSRCDPAPPDDARGRKSTSTGSTQGVTSSRGSHGGQDRPTPRPVPELQAAHDLGAPGEAPVRPWPRADPVPRGGQRGSGRGVEHGPKACPQGIEDPRRRALQLRRPSGPAGGVPGQP